MKKLFLLLSATILMSVNNYSQVIQNSFASEVKSSAYEAAIADGLAEPKLVFVATADIEIILFGLPVPSTFNMQDGTAGVWFYVFTDAEFQTFLGYMLFKSAVGSVSAVPVEPEDILSEYTPISTEKTLDDFEWPDSDVAAETFRGSNQLMEAYNKEHDFFALALFVNGGTPNANLDEPYWAALVSSEDSETFCIMHAINKDIMCYTVASVIDNILNNVIVYPNPAQDFVNLAFESTEVLGAFEIQLFDALGTLQNSIVTQYSNSVKIDTKALTPGTYFIRIGTKFYPFVKN